MEQEPFVVVTGRQAVLRREGASGRAAIPVEMGSRLPLLREEKKHWVVQVPGQGSDGSFQLQEASFAREEDLSRGNMPLTAGNIISQAFKCLGQEYGWGGTGEKTDCSRLILDVFQCFGLEMPRTSHLQAASFRQHKFPKDQQEKKKVLHNLPAGAAILEFPGHIGLYLGEQDGRAFLIHAVWTYAETENGQEKQMEVKKVVVSDLSLGSTGKNKSLFERLLSAGTL
jgi:hypothetical protein